MTGFCRQGDESSSYVKAGNFFALNPAVYTHSYFQSLSGPIGAIISNSDEVTQLRCRD
jgi:hypothetical protein